MRAARRLGLASALVSGALALGGAALLPAYAWAGPAEEARFVQLSETMTRLAQRNAWKGVEDAWLEAKGLGQPIPPAMLALAAESARNLGDTWNAYQRLVAFLRAMPDDAQAVEVMARYRAGYGRLTVRRVEMTPIALSRESLPFDPDELRSIEFATAILAETGGFDGMIPIGVYQIGPHTVEVQPGMEPAILQREMGDGVPPDGKQPRGRREGNPPPPKRSLQ